MLLPRTSSSFLGSNAELHGQRTYRVFIYIIAQSVLCDIGLEIPFATQGVHADAM
jgi:hypothetical protein